MTNVFDEIKFCLSLQKSDHLEELAQAFRSFNRKGYGFICISIYSYQINFIDQNISFISNKKDISFLEKINFYRDHPLTIHCLS